MKSIQSQNPAAHSLKNVWMQVRDPVKYWLAGVGVTYSVALFVWIFFRHSYPFLHVITRGDARVYIQIARDGYQFGDPRVAFYPLYPILIHFLSLLLFFKINFYSLAYSALIVSGAASLWAMIFLDRLCRRYLNDSARRLCLLLWAISPAGVFLATGYSMSLFFAFLFAGFLAAEEEKWWKTGGYVALACLTWPMGYIAYMAIVINIVYLLYRRKIPRISFAMIGGLLLPLIAISVHICYFGIAFHDPFASFHAEQGNWQQHFLPVWKYPGFIARTIVGTAGLSWFPLILELSYCALMACILFYAFLLKDPRYSFLLKFFAGAVLVSILFRSSGSAIPRFLITAFPLFFVIADRYHSQWAHRLVITLGFLYLNLVGTAIYMMSGPYF